MDVEKDELEITESDQLKQIETEYDELNMDELEAVT